MSVHQLVETPPRGAIKEYRALLNARHQAMPVIVNHRNWRYRQVSRGYGDYLYFQDREKFDMELREWWIDKQLNRSEKL